MRTAVLGVLGILAAAVVGATVAYRAVTKPYWGVTR